MYVSFIFCKTTQGSLSNSPEFVCTTPKRAQKMSNQATITNLFQRALDNGANVQATFPEGKIEAQPPPTRQCANRTGKNRIQCKRRVPLDFKWKLCDRCRGIRTKSVQKRRAAFRADPAAQAAVAAQVVVPPGHVRCSKGANSPGWCKRTFSSKSKFKFCAECRASVNKSDQKRRADPEIRAQEAQSHREYRQTPAGKASQKRSNKKPVHKLRNCLYTTLHAAGAQSRTLQELGTLSTNKAVEKHLESTFEPWMTWANHGTLRHTDWYKTTWHIGHRIPCSVYNLDNLEDARKCFDKRNLYAQDARENIELRDRLVLTDRELLKLKPIWPNSAHYMSLEEFKTQFQPASDKSRAVLSAKLQAESEKKSESDESKDESEEESEEESEGEDEEESEESESEEEESEAEEEEEGAIVSD